MGKRVLIVDDYPDAARVLCDVLGFLGHECKPAVNGREALEVCAALRPEVVLLDLGLPDISGYELAPQLRTLLAPQTVRIAALTGWGAPADRARSAAAGIDEHILKPPSLAKLSSIIEGGAPISESAQPARS
jgi:CheY-like chemotaxis protein